METLDRQVKQVIILDKSKGCNTGKYVSQGAHASLGALLKMFTKLVHTGTNETYTVCSARFGENSILDKWLNGIFTKICLAANTEEEMLDIYHKVIEYNQTHENDEQIPVVLIEDCGKTCFHGEKTKTAVGIGPFWSDIIDKFTGELKLFR